MTVTTGALTVTVTYTNELGVTGRSTGAFATPAGAGASRLFQMPLQAGDSGVQQITNVTGTVATVGTFNVLILRPIWSGRVRSANDGGSHGLDLTGLAEVFVDSAILLAIAPDSTSSGSPDLTIEIAVK